MRHGKSEPRLRCRNGIGNTVVHMTRSGSVVDLHALVLLVALFHGPFIDDAVGRPLR